MMFGADFYSNNRKQLIKQCEDGLIVIAGNGLVQRSGDVNYSFRQDSNFLYLTGISEPDLILVINTVDGTEHIIIPKRDEIAVIFDGDSDSQEFEVISGIESVLSEDDGWAYIKSHTLERQIYFNVPSELKVRGLFSNPGRQTAYKRLKRLSSAVKDARPLLANLRMIKQDQEIIAITKAVEITKSALNEVQSHITTARNENDLLKILNVAFTKQNVNHSFAPMVQAGKNATTLHYDKNNQPIRDNQSILLDVGAEYFGYAADISRTYVKGSNNRVAEVIDAVQSIQSELISLIAPGVTWKSFSDYSLQLTARELKRLNISKKENETRKYFPHAIGHFMGLDVHDVGDYSIPLAEGMVITVEPGMYIPIEEIGVRVEDDILVTKTGAKVL